jgi:hypothetical protein
MWQQWWLSKAVFAYDKKMEKRARRGVRIIQLVPILVNFTVMVPLMMAAE